MKIEFDKKKSAEVLSGLVQSTVDFGKKAAADAKVGVAAMVEKSKADNYARKIKKYNPLFPEQYKNESFNLPNIIMIVDDAVRRGIDVCEGAIGWLSKESGVEVLCLYDEAVEFSGVQFVPAVTCDAVYYVDGFNRNRFIRTDCIFSKAHEERMAELKHVAYCLGAKRCTIEISESSSDTQVQNKSVKLSESFKGISSTESAEQNIAQTGKSRRSGHIEVEFQGNDTPQTPELKWFAHDDNIKRLIEMCSDGKRAVKTETLELAGSSSATMSQKTACAIDGAIGKMGGAKGNTSMDAQAAKEHHSKLLFHIEF